MKIFASRILTALLAVLLLLTAAACTPAEGELETNPVIGDGTASPVGTSAPSDTPPTPLPTPPPTGRPRGTP